MKSYFLLAIFYFSSYYFASNNLHELYAILILLVLIFQLHSFNKSIYVLMIAIFIPFFDRTPLFGFESLTLSRLSFLIFFIHAINTTKIEEFNLNNSFTFNTLLFSVAMVIFFSGVEFSLDEQDFNNFVSMRMFGYILDLGIIFCFFYYLFTRKKLDELPHFLAFLFCVIIFQSITFISLIIENPQYLEYNSYSTGGTKADLVNRVVSIEDNVIFGNRNTVAVNAGFVSIIGIILLFNFNNFFKKNNSLIYISILLSLSVVLVSLSRRAYVLVLLGIFLILLFNINFKLITFVALISLSLVFFPIDFLNARIGSLFSVRSFSDLQAVTSGQLHSEALQQFLSNITIIPNSFNNNIEVYNASESYWSALLYRQGIVGFLISFFMLFSIYARCFYYSRQAKVLNNKDLENFQYLLMIITLLFFGMSFFVTIMNFVNYIGDIGQIGFIAFFLFFVNEKKIYDFNKNKKI